MDTILKAGKCLTLLFLIRNIARLKFNNISIIGWINKIKISSISQKYLSVTCYWYHTYYVCFSIDTYMILEMFVVLKKHFSICGICFFWILKDERYYFMFKFILSFEIGWGFVLLQPFKKDIRILKFFTKLKKKSKTSNKLIFEAEIWCVECCFFLKFGL